MRRPDLTPALGRRRPALGGALGPAFGAALGVALGVALGAGAAAAQAPVGAGGGWRVGVAAEAEGGVAANPRYAAAPDTAGAAGRARLAAGIARRGPRGAVSLGATGELQRYRAAADLARTTYGAAADAERRLTPRLTVRGGARAATALTRDAGGGWAGAGGAAAGAAGALPLLPLALVRSAGGSAWAGYQLTPRTGVAAEASAERTAYDTRALAGGTAARVRVAAARVLGPPGAPGPASAGVTVLAERSRLGGRTLASQTATLDWTARLAGDDAGRAVELRLQAGASAFGGTGAVAVRPAGGAELAGRAPAGGWALRYARGVTPVPGVGELLATDGLGASLARRLPGGLELRAAADQAWLRAPRLGQRVALTSATAELRRTLAGGAWAGLGGAVRRRRDAGAPGAPPVRAHDLNVRAGYAASW